MTQAAQKTQPTTYVPSFRGRRLGPNPTRPRTATGMTLSWASGLRGRKEVDGEWLEYIYAGLFCDRGRDQEFDAAMDAAKFLKIELWHEKWVEHWDLSKVALHLLAEGVQSKGEMYQSPERRGLAYGRGANQGKSFFRLQVMPQKLLGLWDKPLVLSLGSNFTDYGLKLLEQQLEISDAARACLLASEGEEYEVPLWTHALPIRSSADRVPFIGRSGKRSDVYVPVAISPRKDQLAAYLTACEVKTEEAMTLLAKLSAESVQWSTDLTQQIIAGNEEAMLNGVG